MRAARALALAAAPLAPLAAVQPHAGQPLAPHDLWAAWNFSPSLVLGLAALAWLYWRGARASQRRLGRGSGWRLAAFGGAWLALFAALVSPLDRLSEALFSAHMAQHMLLILVAAPLLALSAPIGPLLLGLPPAERARLGHAWKRARPLRVAWRALSHPASAFGLHVAALWAWHLPGPYQAALQAEWLHAVEHGSFLVTALLFWWALVRPPRRFAWLRGPAGTLYLFALALQGGLLGALMTFAPQPWYPAYGASTAAWGLTALDDQQLAGAIMWIPAGLVYTAAALAVLGAWLSNLERRVEPRRLETWQPAVDKARP